mgnify:CR=1 FL=1
MCDEGGGVPELMHIAIGCFNNYMKSAKLPQLGGRARLKNRCTGYTAAVSLRHSRREQATPGY